MRVQLVESLCWSTSIIRTGYTNNRYPKGNAHISTICIIPALKTKYFFYNYEYDYMVGNGTMVWVEAGGSIATGFYIHTGWTKNIVQWFLHHKSRVNHDLEWDGEVICTFFLSQISMDLIQHACEFGHSPSVGRALCSPYYRRRVLYRLRWIVSWSGVKQPRDCEYKMVDMRGHGEEQRLTWSLYWA
jgi:hypothetical protein